MNVYRIEVKIFIMEGAEPEVYIVETKAQNYIMALGNVKLLVAGYNTFRTELKYKSVSPEKVTA